MTEEQVKRRLLERYPTLRLVTDDDGPRVEDVADGGPYTLVSETHAADVARHADRTVAEMEERYPPGDDQITLTADDERTFKAMAAYWVAATNTLNELRGS
jgi:hypothetical protein